MDSQDIEGQDDGQDVLQISQKEYVRTVSLEMALRDALMLSESQLFSSLQLKKHTDIGFIRAETLITLVRGGFGRSRRCKEQIALALNEQIVKALSYFLRKNPSWGFAFNLSSESREELVHEAWVHILALKGEISFAEVNFLTYINARFLDWFISQTRLKNCAPSTDQFDSGNEHNEHFSLVGQLIDDDGKTPEQLTEIRELVEKSQASMLNLPKKQRDAIYYYLLCDYSQKDIAKLMGSTEKSVRTYIKSGLETLKKGMGK